jgi:two-component system chemotaxis sensor kinase CheA
MTPEEIQQIFFGECEEALVEVETGLSDCRAGQETGDTVNAIFRAVHSVKGGAGAFGFTALQAFAHGFEALLSEVRDGTVALQPELVDLLLTALDTLSDHVAAARNDTPPPEDAALIAELAHAAGGGVPQALATQVHDAAGADTSGAETETGSGPDFDLDSLLDDIAGNLSPETAGDGPGEWLVHVRPRAGAMRNGSEPMLLLRELASLGGVCRHCDLSELPPLDALQPGEGYLGWTFAMPACVEESAVRDIFDFIGEDCAIAIGGDAAIPEVLLDAQPEPEPSPAPAPTRASETLPVASVVEAAESTPSPPPSAPQSIRIDLGKLDRLVDTVGELVTAQAMLAQRLAGEGMAGCEELLALESLVREIQESAMAIRAQPIGSVFSRVPRILRELAQSTGKYVKLAVSGEATELDKTVIERLGEPLTHLIRNAVDHGIEPADVRINAGKPAEGTLTLSAEHRSGRILIRISDDGRGIDRAKVLAKAIERKLVPADAQLLPEEIDALIFAPGFSTAAQVTSVSGRGVGMDVVRQNVKDLGGRITIDAEEGRGTTFTLALPLTLAISDGMVVGAADQTLVVPLAHVVESLRPAPGTLHRLGAGNQLLDFRGRFIPVVPVHEIVGRRGGNPAPENGVLIVVDTEVAGRAALLVDDIFDQRQFVIKSLDTHYRPVEGIAGATILGDGQVALIVDVDGLVASVQSVAERRAA